MGRDDLIGKLLTFAEAHETWEAHLILSDEAWRGGMAEFPTLTQELYDEFMAVQGMRNEAVGMAREAGLIAPAEASPSPARPAPGRGPLPGQKSFLEETD